jgi:hypothetical protein
MMPNAPDKPGNGTRAGQRPLPSVFRRPVLVQARRVATARGPASTRAARYVAQAFNQPGDVAVALAVGVGEVAEILQIHNGGVPLFCPEVAAAGQPAGAGSGSGRCGSGSGGWPRRPRWDDEGRADHWCRTGRDRYPAIGPQAAAGTRPPCGPRPSLARGLRGGLTRNRYQ